MGGDGTHSPVLPSFTHTPSAWPWSRARTGNTQVLVSSPQPCSGLQPGLVAPAHCGVSTEGPGLLACFTLPCGFQLWLGGGSAHRHRSELLLEAPCFDGVCLSPTESGSN